ncbi:hypothetical protein KUTeg_006487 [Tegillarca granosa]|uniref:Nephrin/kirre n=1 Tax=Tegillarca granosa TaxID=220873 RepID=A0ABQ9FGM9_TEGGR|nr:hypothetical protein KUTeg_006487 [Tegillarca granosa]
MFFFFNIIFIYFILFYFLHICFYFLDFLFPLIIFNNPSTPPEPPSEFSLAENGTKSIKVTWKRGFNGGLIQTFVIRFTDTVTLETKETTIEDTNQSSNYTIEIDRLEPNPPSADPVISGYSGTTTYLGNTVTLTCTLDGGNPLATLTWTCKGLNVQGVNSNTQTSAISRYSVTIDTNPPTTNPVVSGYDGTFRYQDDVVTLTCTLSGGSPPATLSWTCNGQQQAEIRQSTSGTTGISDITVAMKKELNGKTCTCHGRHSDTRYSPNISNPPSNPLVEVLPETPFQWIERGNGKLRCSVNDGNPPVSYEWSSPDGVVSGQTSPILILTSLTKDDNKKGYSCKVLNAYTIAKDNPELSIGPSPVYIKETDSFERLCTADGNPPPTITWTSNTIPPTVQAILKQTSITEGQTVYIYCLASGVPDNCTYGGWVQEYRGSIIRSVNEYILSQNKQNLTLARVTHQDIGIYRCKAHNTITDIYGVLFQHGTTNLFQHSRKFFAELDKTVEIRIPFFANPKIHNADKISLTKENISKKDRTDIKMNIETKYFDIVFHGKTIIVDGQQAIIQFFQFKSELQGNYTIGIKNYDQGSVSTFVFQVILSGPPDHPKLFKILSSTSDSITVSWIAGSNGGHQQTFVILYQQTEKDETLKTKNITETDKKLNYTLTISELKPGTDYTIWIYSYNSKGNTKTPVESTNRVSITTKRLEQYPCNCNNNDGIFIGLVVGIIIGVLSEGLAVLILLWRKGILNGKESHPGENRQETQYEDINNEGKNENGYDGIKQQREGEERNQEFLGAHEEYEHLDNTRESAAYQRLNYEGAETIQMTYENTVVK